MINVDIYVLSLDEVMDFQLDENIQIAKLIAEICEMLINKMKQRAVISTSEFLLCLPEKEQILSFHKKLKDYGVKNGDRLLLV